MNSVGGFREGEIDGKPFHIFHFLSQIDNPSSSSYPGEAATDSGGDDLSPPLFICQSFRWSGQWLHRRLDNVDCNDFISADVSPHPHLFNKRSGDEQFKFLIGSDIYDHTCKLPLVPLFWCNNKELEYQYQEFHCNVCQTSTAGIGYYLCVTCSGISHKECIESPLEIKHPSFPFLSLKLYYPPPLRFPRCTCCQKHMIGMFYYCPTYKLILHPMCAMKPIPILIDHPKRHPHPLTFFPKQNSLPCDVCGLIKEHFPTYVCARCVFVVHQDCVYFPHAIKISRHHHRVFFIYSLPFGKWSCGVCRQKVDNHCGAYSCNKCDGYFVHTKCALRRDLWDGKELEGIPEEPEIVVEPFEKISDGIIVHFSHGHHLKLEMSRDYDEHKFCQACILPIYDGSYYSCMDQCDFILHEVCANAPCKKQHALHAHSLTLKVVTNEYLFGKGHFDCDGCRRKGCGFIYEIHERGSLGFRLDLRCASVSEPFEYEGHEHPLFLALTPEEEESTVCQICQEEGDRDNRCKKLNCIECKFVICFACATLPYKARYKHDKHLLTFRKKEEASVDHPDWCDVCETKIARPWYKKKGFYSCDDYCSTTVHVNCLLGVNTYMKHGQTVDIHGKEVDILSNKTMSRPLCYLCKKRCSQKLVFKTKSKSNSENVVLCSLSDGHY